MSGFATLIYEKEGPLALVTLNRPRFLNAYNLQMRDDLFEVLNAIRDDDEVRVALIKGAGEKAFCAGADLSEFLTAPSPVEARRIRFDRDVWGLFLSIPQPLIAVLHGYVLGSGIEMALCCDLRIAADNAQFGLPEVELGIIPAAGGTQTLSRTVGPTGALELLLTGRRIDAREAERINLVNRVVPPDRLVETARGMADKIAAGNPRAVRAVKQAVLGGMDLPLAQGLELENRLAANVSSSMTQV
jgi:enoyl-CoA hydratase/carnithine racemase